MIAHDFSLKDQLGKERHLSDYLGKWVILYFYPKDDTPDCTIQACDFRDQSAELLARNVAVLGISADTISSHREFSAKYNLNFPLLSDVSTSTIKDYDAWGVRSFLGEVALGIIRMTYLIDPEGNVAKVFPDVAAKGHVDLILEAIDELQADEANA